MVLACRRDGLIDVLAGLARVAFNTAPHKRAQTGSALEWSQADSLLRSGDNVTRGAWPLVDNVREGAETCGGGNSRAEEYQPPSQLGAGRTGIDSCAAPAARCG
jgi:hypothetical protein